MYNPTQFGSFGANPQCAIGMNWVANIAEAERIELPPGGTAIFFDKVNDGLMYIRTRDSYNIYNTRTFKIDEVKPKEPESPYVTRTELEQMFQKFLGGAGNDTLRTNDESDAASAGEPTGGTKRTKNG